ncbi:GPP34 family phosphoprotein [Lentilactobacillus hilgardii]|uniref:GPP34 family phosphoprotein n=1 Tax=Lentilactobacillus hilgardii TaxID=1588 RepID=UPI003FA5ED53
MKSDISEMYLLLNETDGNRSAIMRSMRKRAYLSASVLFDLQLGGIIKLTDKGMQVIAPLSKDYGFLNPVLDILNDRENKSSKNSLRHVVLNRKINRIVYDGIGEKLLFKNKATKTSNRGLIFSHDKYIPRAEAKKLVVNQIKVELLGSNTASLEIVALVANLSRSRTLKNYFDKDQRAQLTQQVKDLRHNPEYETFFKFAKWVDDFITAIIVAASSSHG